jgi:hypothetical protein
MKTTGTTLRQSFVSAHPLTFALGGSVVALGVVLAGTILLRSPEPASAPAESGASAHPVVVYDATGAMQAAIGPSADQASVAARPAAVYDATGAMLAAVESDAALTTSGARHVYDATGAMLEAISVEAPGSRVRRDRHHVGRAQ